VLGLVALLEGLTYPAEARAQGSESPAGTGEAAERGPQGEPAEGVELARYRRLLKRRGGYARLFTTLMFGRGLRFNNPYRLRTQLGDTAESVSLTAPYFDASFNTCFGRPNGVQHGGSLHFSIALEGVGQQAIAPSYLIAYRGSSPMLGYGRIGLSVLLSPDVSVGGELAAGFAYFLTGSWGLSAELVGNLFYGAGSYESSYSIYPILSLQLDMIADFEVLP